MRGFKEDEMIIGSCYWRFKGDRAYRYGYATNIRGTLYRMGRYNGDTTGGVIVDKNDVEWRDV